jgi:ABC-2 type transport system permease protein
MAIKKALQIAVKDVRIRVTDRAAFIFLLLTPLVLTLILGAAFGGLGGDDGGDFSVSTAVVNLDDGELGQALLDLLTGDELSDLLVTQVVGSESAARRLVDAENYAAAVIIPAGFTAAALPTGPNAPQGAGDSSGITLYANPTAATGANIVRAIVEAFAWQVSGQIVGGQIAIEHLLAAGALRPTELMDYAQDLASRSEEGSAGQGGAQLARLEPESLAGAQVGSDTDWIIAYYAPSMAIMFLSFGVTQGARTILQERRSGTLGRLLTTPTPSASILGGKLLSTFLLGLLQFVILIGASALLFNLDWGPPLAVALFSLAVVGAMTSLGIAIAGVVRSEEQVNTWGVAILLVFSAISGNFIPRFGFPTWLRTLGLITPNAWALEGFTKLGTGAGLADIRLELLALVAMALLLFVLGVLRFRVTITSEVSP